jgi:pSer/pThr/pTyr-binding forkhead associated (FHA) protein
MIHLEIDGERYPIAAGDTVIGTASENPVVLVGEGVRPRHAVVQATAKGAAAIRPAESGAEILVNGVRLGAEPTPLLHGDKIGIGKHELLVVDPARAGSTQLFDSGAFADLVASPVPAKAPGKTGGRLVCLTDGREYTVGTGSLTFGRDASADVVVAGNDVSRQHAELRSDPEGYILIDNSVNGTYVNGERVGKTRRLSRADVIRIGNDEFRFYADSPALSSPAKSAPKVPAVEPPPPPGVPPSGASARLSDTMHGAPVAEVPRPNTPPSPGAAPLASLLFRSGDMKGKRLPIKVPVVNIGRGDYNDVVIADPSVSTMHAKLQRREAVWVLTDLGSTNGTFVEGEPLKGELPLSPGTTIRFGDVSALFEPLDDKVPSGRGKGTQVMEKVEAKPAPAGPRREPELEADRPRPRPQPRRPIRVAPPRPKAPSTIMVFGLVILVAILAYLLSS